MNNCICKLPACYTRTVCYTRKVPITTGSLYLHIVNKTEEQYQLRKRLYWYWCKMICPARTWAWQHQEEDCGVSSQRRPCLHLLLPIFPRPSLLSCVGTRGISRLSPIIEGIEHNGARYSSNVVMQSRGSRGFGGSFSDGLRANWKKISTSAKHHTKASMNLYF